MGCSSDGLDTARANAGGYYVPTAGNDTATFFNLFLRLRPKLIVNDNIYIKSELWFGDPLFGIFGNAVPYSFDQRLYYSSQSRGSIVSAQRFWGELVTDLGTIQVGRVPLHWGLGVVWNEGGNLWDRYMSTGDAIRWIAKFGSVSLIPSFIVESTGNTIGGACTLAGGACTPTPGWGGVTDTSLILKYDNTEDEFEAGGNLIRRYGGAAQDPNAGLYTPGNQAGNSIVASDMNYFVFDLFVKKKFNTLSLAAEVPFTSGTIGGGVGYSGFGLAGEADWKLSEAWRFLLKSGYASGQDPQSSSTLGQYKAFYFNPNYHIAMILFNYQLANFANTQTLNNPNASGSNLNSPYDNPIVDAAYFALETRIKPWDKWTLRPNFAYAFAPSVATNGNYFLNTWSRSLVQNNSGKSQSSSLGFEVDLGITFQWDEYFQFHLDNGLFFPGGYYAFSNTAKDNSTAAVFASSVRIGINF